MRRIARLVSMVTLLLTLAASAPVAGITVNATPESQTNPHGVKADWHLNWGGNDPFWAYFDYGDGSTPASWENVTFTHRDRSRAFFPCNSTTYTQALEVFDSASAYGLDVTQATELGGSPC